MSTLLYLVRHGLTAANQRQTYMGRSDEPLCNEGRWQSRQLARRLRRHPFAVLYSSPLPRARQTAEIILQHQGCPLELDPDLTELDLTRWQGLAAAEIAAREPEAWRIWCSDPAALSLAGIEPLHEVRRRVHGALERYVAAHPGARVAAVTHDGVVRIAVLDALGLPLSLYRSLPVDNAGVTVLEIGGHRNRLRTFNDTAHLDGTGPAGAADP